MTLGEIFGILFLGMFLFLPFTILFSPKVKNKLNAGQNQKNVPQKDVKPKKNKQQKPQQK